MSLLKGYILHDWFDFLDEFCVKKQCLNDVNIFSIAIANKLAFKPGGGGGTPLQEANRDVPLDGVAFSRLEWL